MSQGETTGETSGAAEFTEAPFSVTVKVNWRGYDMMVTTRGVTGSEALPRALAAIGWLEDRGAAPTLRAPKIIHEPGLRAADQDFDPWDAPDDEPPAKPTPPTKRGAASADAGSPAEQRLELGKIVTAFKPDGRVGVEMFGVGHKFPDIKALWSPMVATEILQSVGVTLPATGAIEAAVPGVVAVYHLGKEYTTADGKTGRYKDFQRLER